MAYRKSDDQLLRKVFDVAYDELDQLQKIDHDEVKAKLQRAVRVNRQVLTYSFAAVVVAVVIVITTYALTKYFDYLAWENRPSFAQRVVAPYELETQLPPYLLNAVTVDAQVDGSLNFVTSNISYYPISEQPTATYVNTKVVQLQSIVPAAIGNFTLHWNRVQSNLLTNCLVFAGAEETGRCAKPATAEFLEMANFVDSNGNTLGLVMTKYATEEEAAVVMNSVFRYARSIGRIGNFSFIEPNDVDYFFSITRAAKSFTWMNRNWVLSVSAESFDTVDAFMAAFPLYENNPELAQIVVEQIPPSTPEPVVEEQPAIVPEATAEVTAEAVEGATEAPAEAASQEDASG